jgi:adenine nucleotide transporter 17
MAESQGSAAFIALVQASAGAAGGVFATVVLMPLEVAKTKIQISQKGNASTLRTMQEIARNDGLSGLFSGVTPKSIETGLKNFVYFYLYDFINTIVKGRVRLTTPMKLFLGYIAGVGTTLTTMPLELLATRVQAEGKDTLVVLQHILRKEGISGLFKGLISNIILCINPAIQNTCFDNLKLQLLMLKSRADPHRPPAMTSLQGFTLGVLAKAVASTITHPLVRYKTMIQAGKKPVDPQAANVADSGDEHPSGMMRSMSSMSFRLDTRKKEQNLVQRFMQLYRGLGSTLLKSSLQAGLLYMTKDQVSAIIARLFKISAKLLRRRDGQLKLGVFSGRPLPS